MERPIDDRHGGVEVVRVLQGCLAAEREYAHLVAGFAQIARWHCFQRYGIGWEGGHGLRRFGGKPSWHNHRACNGAASLQKFPPSLFPAGIHMLLAHISSHLTVKPLTTDHIP